MSFSVTQWYYLRDKDHQLTATFLSLPQLWLRSNLHTRGLLNACVGHLWEISWFLICCYWHLRVYTLLMRQMMGERGRTRVRSDFYQQWFCHSSMWLAHVYHVTATCLSCDRTRGCLDTSIHRSSCFDLQGFLTVWDIVILSTLSSAMIHLHESGVTKSWIPLQLEYVRPARVFKIRRRLMFIFPMYVTHAQFITKLYTNTCFWGQVEHIRPAMDFR
jgi:hypothetical protein